MFSIRHFLFTRNINRPSASFFVCGWSFLKLFLNHLWVILRPHAKLHWNWWFRFWEKWINQTDICSFTYRKWKKKKFWNEMQCKKKFRSFKSSNNVSTFVAKKLTINMSEREHVTPLIVWLWHAKFLFGSFEICVKIRFKRRPALLQQYWNFFILFPFCFLYKWQ